MSGKTILASVLTLLFFLTASAPVWAHQPYFEEDDFTAAAPYTVADPTVSTAVYATLESRGDVDYYVFDGREGQSILLELTIPQIDGQENFTPTLALIGAGLPRIALPKAVDQPSGSGALILRADPGPASVFNEPFSGTSYWDRQSTRATLPADGRYTVAVWNEAGDVGRYTFVIGDREIFGGDRGFARKIREYWTPVTLIEPTETPVTQPTYSGCGGK